MSVKMMSLVWEHSTQKNSKLVAMLAIADQADDDGVCCRMALTRSDEMGGGKFDVLAEKVRVSTRQIHEVMSALEESGEIYTEHNGGRHQINRYLVAVGRSFDSIRLALVRRFDMPGDEAAIIAEKLTCTISNKNPAENSTVSESAQGNSAENRTVLDDSQKINGAENSTVLESAQGNSAENRTVYEAKTVRKTAKTVRKTAPLINNNINKRLKDSKTKDSDSGDSEFGEIVTIYAQNINPNFSPSDAEALADTYDTLTPPPGETRLAWFSHAILGACENNVLNRSYVERILQNIQDAGSLARHKKSKDSPRPAATPITFPAPAAKSASTPAPSQPVSADSDTWKAILATLKGQMTRATFTQFSGTYPVGRNGQSLVVAVPNPQALEWLQFRLQAPIDRAAGGIEPGLCVKFVSATPQPA